MAVERGRWDQINAGVSPGIVISSVVVASAWRSVASGGAEEMMHIMSILMAEEVASTFAAIAMDGKLMADKAVWATGLHGVRGIIHIPVHVHLGPHTMVWPQYRIVSPIFVKGRCILHCTLSQQTGVSAMQGWG